MIVCWKCWLNWKKSKQKQVYFAADLAIHKSLVIIMRNTCSRLAMRTEARAQPGVKIQKQWNKKRIAPIYTPV